MQRANLARDSGRTWGTTDRPPSAGTGRRRGRLPNGRVRQSGPQPEPPVLNEDCKADRDQRQTQEWKCLALKRFLVKESVDRNEPEARVIPSL